LRRADSGEQRAVSYLAALRLACSPAATTPTTHPSVISTTPAYDMYRARSAATSAPGGPGFVRLYSEMV
jgi:hypothetical protein